VYDGIPVHWARRGNLGYQKFEVDVGEEVHPILPLLAGIDKVSFRSHHLSLEIPCCGSHYALVVLLRSWERRLFHRVYAVPGSRVETELNELDRGNLT
jgi:hypothetical protein